MVSSPGVEGLRFSKGFRAWGVRSIQMEHQMGHV